MNNEERFTIKVTEEMFSVLEDRLPLIVEAYNRMAIRKLDEDTILAKLTYESHGEDYGPEEYQDWLDHEPVEHVAIWLLTVD